MPNSALDVAISSSHFSSSNLSELIQKSVMACIAFELGQGKNSADTPGFW